MRIELNLEDEAQTLEAMAKVLIDVEEGRGADGVGHGVLKPPSEGLLEHPSSEAEHL
jgi:hypothetical protein